MPAFAGGQSMSNITFKQISGHNRCNIPEELIFTSGEHLAATAALVAGRPVRAFSIGTMLCAFLVGALLPLLVVAAPLCLHGDSRKLEYPAANAVCLAQDVGLDTQASHLHALSGACQ